MRIPFEWMPGSWGLKGKTKARAKAEYEMAAGSYELARTLLRIDYDVTKEQEEGSIEEIPLQFQRGLLELDLSFDKISNSFYQNAIATIEGNPFVRVIESGFDWEQGPGGFWMEFDWNYEFIEFLKDQGYEGAGDPQIFDSWLADIYRSQILENELSGEDQAPEPEELQIRAKPREDGKIEYL